MPQGPFTAAQIEAAIAVVTGKAPEPKKERTNDELIVLIRAAALHGWERGRPDDEHSQLLRAALAHPNGPPPQTIFKKLPSTWRRKDWNENGRASWRARVGQYVAISVVPVPITKKH